MVGEQRRDVRVREGRRRPPSSAARLYTVLPWAAPRLPVNRSPACPTRDLTAPDRSTRRPSTVDRGLRPSRRPRALAGDARRRAHGVDLVAIVGVPTRRS